MLLARHPKIHRSFTGKGGVRVDPDKTAAISRIETDPHTITDPHRFIGMVNQLGKF